MLLNDAIALNLFAMFSQDIIEFKKYLDELQNNHQTSLEKIGFFQNQECITQVYKKRDDFGSLVLSVSSYQDTGKADKEIKEFLLSPIGRPRLSR